MLPKEACGLQKWVNDLLTQIGTVDRSIDRVLTKAALFYLKNERRREECANDPLQGGLPRFSRHVARALSSSAVLMTSPDLGAEISRYVNYNLAHAKPVSMGPILSAIGKFCSFREEHTAGHHMLPAAQTGVDEPSGRHAACPDHRGQTAIDSEAIPATSGDAVRSPLERRPGRMWFQDLVTHS